MRTTFIFINLTLILLASTSNAQTVNQIYDHADTDLNQLHNMPFDESKLLVVTGFSFMPAGLEYHELDFQTSQLVNISFTDVDTIRSEPELKDDKLFFEASVNGIGRELVIYDGTSTNFVDFNLGLGSSEPEIIKFEDDIFVIANNGSFRQLYRYAGGTSFEQVSEETQDNVEYFVAQRGNEYYYITFSSLNGRSVKSTEDNNGVLTHSYIAPGSYQETLEDVVILNDDIFMLHSFYSAVDAGYRVDKIDLNNLITTHHFETGANISSGHLFKYVDDVLFYRTEPGHADITNVTVAQQSFIQVSLDPSQYSTIGGHVVQNDKLHIYGNDYVLDLSGTTPVPVIDDGSLIKLIPAFELDSSFYLYEVAPFSSGEPSGIIEVSSVTNQSVRYTVSNDGGFFFHTGHTMVENNGDVKFIFKTEDGVPSTDIYSFGSVLDIEKTSKDDFDLYPNPIVNGHFSISLPQEGPAKIVTLDGHIVETLLLHKGPNIVQVENLSSGVYLIQFEQSVQRLVVH